MPDPRPPRVVPQKADYPHPEAKGRGRRSGGDPPRGRRPSAHPSKPPQPVSILGIDPGLSITGYGLVRPSSIGVKRPRGSSGAECVEAGVIESQPGQPLEGRLVEIYQGLEEVLSDLKPSVIAVEALYSHGVHPRTAILMGHVRGVVFCLAGLFRIPVIGYGATQVKKSLTGSGRASKSQVQRAVQVALNLRTPPEPLDVADALAVALCHLDALKGPLAFRNAHDRPGHRHH